MKMSGIEYQVRVDISGVGERPLYCKTAMGSDGEFHFVTTEYEDWLGRLHKVMSVVGGTLYRISGFQPIDI